MGRIPLFIFKQLPFGFLGSCHVYDDQNPALDTHVYLSCFFDPKNIRKTKLVGIYGCWTDDFVC